MSHLDVGHGGQPQYICGVDIGKLYIFQKDSTPSHITHMTQEWLTECFYNHVISTMWLAISSNLIHLDYSIWDENYLILSSFKAVLNANSGFIE